MRIPLYLPFLVSCTYVCTHTSCQATDGQCEEGWRGYRSSCYLLVESKVNTAAARAGCAERGATLASISDDEENNFLKNFISEKAVGTAWIGLVKKPSGCNNDDVACRRRDFQWTDGTPYDSDTWHAWWISVEPHRDDDCAFLRAERWVGVRCTSFYSAYICEKAAITTTTVTTTTPARTKTTSTESAVGSSIGDGQPLYNRMSVSLIAVSCVLSVLLLLATLAAAFFYRRWMILRKKLAAKEATEKVQMDENVPRPAESCQEVPVASPCHVMPEVASYETPAPRPEAVPTVYDKISDPLYENP